MGAPAGNNRPADLPDIQEFEMVSRTKLVLALGTVAFLAACAATPQQEEIVYIDEQASAVSAEPVYTGKYK
tara:strand:+ start:389 stop:601 length:213 start_codon:yes stop_codon:yes gene_type:complete